jgi:hypothetical protein
MVDKENVGKSDFTTSQILLQERRKFGTELKKNI